MFDRGYSLQRDFRADDARKGGGGGKRGKLTGEVSSASFRRLREFCITHDVPGDCWGVTLTVPGLDLLSVEDFKNLHHKLCVWCNDHDLPLVWRVELQRRGQPHLHCVAFCDSSLVLRLCSHWFTLLEKLPPVYNVERLTSKVDDLVLVSRAFLCGSSHAVDLQRLNGDFRLWRYLVAHMSKGKAEQLGWAGRNWGVCNRCKFESVAGDGFYLDDRTFYIIRRWIKRLTFGKPSLLRRRERASGCRCNKFLEAKKSKRHYKLLEQGKPGIPVTYFHNAKRVKISSCAYWLGDPSLLRAMIVYLMKNKPLPF